MPMIKAYFTQSNRNSGCFNFSVCFQCGFSAAERLGRRRKNSHNFDDKYVAIPIDFALCRDKIYFQTDKGNLTRNIFIQPDKT